MFDVTIMRNCIIYRASDELNAQNYRSLYFLISMSSVVNLRSAFAGMVGGKPRSPENSTCYQVGKDRQTTRSLRTVRHAVRDNEGSFLAKAHTAEDDDELKSTCSLNRSGRQINILQQAFIPPCRQEIEAQFGRFQCKFMGR